MTVEVMERSGTKWTPSDVERGLHAVALLASCPKAAQETGIPVRTLQAWKTDQHRERYLQIRNEVLPKVMEQAAAESEDLARRYAEVEDQALTQFENQLPDLKPGETASALRNLTVSRGVSIDKALLLRGRPTSITEHRGPDELLRELSRQGFIIDGTASEIQPDPLDAQSVASLPDAADNAR